MGQNLVDVQQRTIGRTLASGPLAFGCWRFVHDDPADAHRVLAGAVEAGLRLVDTADVYGLDFGGAGFGAAEALLGKVLADDAGLRDEITIATKGGIRPGVPYDSSASALRGACDASLQRLGVDHVDLYQVHRPDLFAHPHAVAETLLDLRTSGKIGAIGISNHTPSQYDVLRDLLGDDLVTVQPQYSILHLDPLRDGTFDRCIRDGVRPIVWSPLAGGRLGGGDIGAAGEVATRLARREGVEPAAIALGFVLAHPARPIAILGSQRPDRLAALADAVTHVTLDRADCYSLVEASEGKPLP